MTNQLHKCILQEDISWV